MNKQTVNNSHDLEVYKMAFDAAMKIFELSKNFPLSERFALNDSGMEESPSNIPLSQQLRCSSRCVCTNLAGAWYKLLDETAFISKLNDCMSWVAQTQILLEFAVECNYLDAVKAKEVDETYNLIEDTFISMIDNSDEWIIASNINN
ncbi:four helix bundle protein [Rivularia sp. UHCC 0363]|uniref:four helix bundle protein n=1 Tax=Rivularia sp. UHCC 0363 TaxID=3110244 RepID=UPI002B21AE56|nr:four helix bundle protein [Rivularia sp. UHCC 0363]MEA5596974.1 four helix bundle protein [Rivularia sp. UHCC 0363]